MEGFWNAVIEFATEMRAVSVWSQVLALFGTVGVGLAALGWRHKLRSRQTVAMEAENARLTDRLKGAQSDLQKAEKRLAALEAVTPEAFLAAHKGEMKNGNEEKAMARAEAFVDHHRDALLVAFRSQADAFIGHAVQDGAASFETARLWAIAACALDPTDRDLRLLAEDLAVAASISASGAKPRIDDPATRRKRLADLDRLPDDIDALQTAYQTAFEKGAYRVALQIARHGLTVTRRPPYGRTDQVHFLFQEAYAEALMFGGEATKGLQEIESLLPFLSEVHGQRHPNVLRVRYLRAYCSSEIGDTTTALREIDDLLPLFTEVFGEGHINTLNLRYIRALCLDHQGETRTALAEIDDLLPLEVDALGALHPTVLNSRAIRARCLDNLGHTAEALQEVEDLLIVYAELRGDRHPNVLALRNLRIHCLINTGDTATALREVDALLPITSEVFGERNPDTLEVQRLRASLLLAQGRPAEARITLEGLAEGYEAAGLRPEHRFWRRLADTEATLQRVEGADQ